MLQINPNEIIRINKLINNSLENIKDNIDYFRKKYSGTVEEEKLNIKELNQLTYTLNNSTTFLTNITNELVAATGESLDKILNSNYSLNDYEKMLMQYYANNINNNADENKLNSIDLCYSKDDRLTNYCQKQNFKQYINSYFINFNPEEYGLDKETIINDLLYIFDNRGSKEAYAMMRALENNCPQNYHDYNFNPGNQIHSNSYYDFNNSANNYQINSEIININGYEYEITEVLPKDCTKAEELVYNFGKANIINTMKTLPDKFLETCSKGNSNAIILTTSKEITNNNGNWSGYYKPSSFLKGNTNSITIDIHGSLYNNSFYTQDTLIHEMGHKFDDLIYSKNIIDWILGRNSYTKSTSDWSSAYDKYKNVVSAINLSGYAIYPNVNEFFGDATVAYFKSPSTLKNLCPEVYDLISNMLDGEYGYSYNDKIIQVLNVGDNYG